MSQLEQIGKLFKDTGWFAEPGAYVLVDGQYGSTGKGALAALIAAACPDSVNVVTTNAGPNSGHTGYLPSPSSLYPPTEPTEPPIITRQLPVLGVAANAMWKKPPDIYLNGGAILDVEILRDEAHHYGVTRDQLRIHPCAAVIDKESVEDVSSLKAIASTGKGTGAALARKVMRNNNVAKSFPLSLYPGTLHEMRWNWQRDRVFVETAQGFSLGINSQFYPYCTSRECTVMQAIADARIPHNKVRKVIMAVRTYPIRVGNTAEGQSGGCYPDQEETTWEALGLQPEYTTVTKRVRRVFTWSRQQFREAVAANQPDAIFLNFVNYLKELGPFVSQMLLDYQAVMGRHLELVLFGTGPRPEDVQGQVFNV